MICRRTVVTTVLAAAFGAPIAAHADGGRDIAQLREELRQVKQDYETRIRALEKRIEAVAAPQPTGGGGESVVPLSANRQDDTGTPDADSAGYASVPSAPAVPVAVSAPAASGSASTASAFNPAVSVILGGTFANLSRDPDKYRIQGFVPGGEEVGPGKRSFNLGESELMLSASIDPTFSGQLTASLASDNSVSVEEAFMQTHGLEDGVNLKAGRFLSSVGYLNNIHSHAWDFVDAPLVYQAFFGGQYSQDGVQARWLAPVDRFVELGAEAGNGGSFPGNGRNKNGVNSVAVFGHVGDDIGEGGSWRAGLSYLRTSASGRTYDDTDSTGTDVVNAFSGNSSLWIADAVYKWSPGGNATRTNLKLQAEYFRRHENGTLTYDTTGQSLGTATGSYSSAQSGWYAQGVYQFMPRWRAGVRYDKLYGGTTDIGLVDSGALSASDFSSLTSYNPSKTTLMLDFSPSEFSRIRLQIARDKSSPDEADRQIYLQYIMSLGAHGAHSF